MLVLSRRRGERIEIGDDVVITVLRTRGKNTVVLGVQAPDGTKVIRTEVRERESDGPKGESRVQAA